MLRLGLVLELGPSLSTLVLEYPLGVSVLLDLGPHFYGFGVVEQVGRILICKAEGARISLGLIVVSPPQNSGLLRLESFQGLLVVQSRVLGAIDWLLECHHLLRIVVVPNSQLFLCLQLFNHDVLCVVIVADHDPNCVLAVPRKHQLLG